MSSRGTIRIVFLGVTSLVMAGTAPVLAVVSTNVSFNTSYFARQSTEGKPLDEASLTEAERIRIERVRAAERIRSLPMEDIMALGEPSGGSRDETGKPVAVPKAEELSPSPVSFHWKAEHAVLVALLLAAFGVLFFGGRGKKRT